MPTFLTLVGVAAPQGVQGRPLGEALVRGAAAAPGDVRKVEHTARTPDGRYAGTGRLSILRSGGRNHRYFDGTTVRRR